MGFRPVPTAMPRWEMTNPHFNIGDGGMPLPYVQERSKRFASSPCYPHEFRVYHGADEPYTGIPWCAVPCTCSPPRADSEQPAGGEGRAEMAGPSAIFTRRKQPVLAYHGTNRQGHTRASEVTPSSVPSIPSFRPHALAGLEDSTATRSRSVPLYPGLPCSTKRTLDTRTVPAGPHPNSTGTPSSRMARRRMIITAIHCPSDGMIKCHARSRGATPDYAAGRMATLQSMDSSLLLSGLGSDAT